MSLLGRHGAIEEAVLTWTTGDTTRQPKHMVPKPCQTVPSNGNAAHMQVRLPTELMHGSCSSSVHVICYR